MTLLQQPTSNPLLTAPSYDNPPSDFQTAPQNAATDLFRGLRGAALNSSADSAAVDYYKALQRGDTASAKKHGLRAQQLLQEAAENAPSVQSTGGVHDFDSGVRYVAGQLGALPVGVASPAAAGVLGSLGGAVIASRLGLRGLPVANTLASVGGAVGATGAMAHDLRNAAAMQHFQAGDTQAPGDVLDQSAVQGVAQALPYAAGPVAALPGRIVGRTLLPAAKTMGGALARGAAMNAGMGAGSEYIGQKFQDQWNPNRDRSHDNQGLIDAAVGNAVAAVPFEVPGHMFDKAHQASGAVFDAAKRAAPQVLQKGVDLAGQGADAAKGVWANRPESLEKAGAMAGAMFGDLQNRGEDVATAAAAKRFTKDADIDTLLSPQDGMGADEIAQDDGLKHGAAANLVAKLGQGLHDAPDYVRAAADEYVKGKRDEDSWRGLAAAVNDWQRNTHLNRDMGEMFGEKWQKGMARVGDLAAKLQNAKDAVKDGYDTSRAEAGRSNAQTPLEMNALVRDQRDEFSAVLEKALTPQLKGFDGTVGQDIAAQNLSHGLRLWATNGFKLSKDAQPEVPARMAEYFKDPVAAVGTALDLMERQGVIPPVAPKTKERLLYVLQAKTEAQKSSVDIVAQNLVPTLQDRMRMPQVQGVVNEVLRQIESGKVDRGYVTNHFGPKAQFVLDALGEQQRRLGEVEREGASGRVQASRESDEQKDNTGHEELAGMTDPFTPNEVAADTKWYHYNESQELPYEVGGKIIDLKNVDPETGEYAVKGSHDDHADAKIAELKVKNPGSTYEKVPYMDALAERHGDDIQSVVDAYRKLAAKHGPMSNEEVNKRFYVLREKTARGGEATDVHPDTLRVVDPRNKRENVWAEHVARDANGERVGGTTEEGKIWLRKANGEEFATSTSKIIKHISDGTRREQASAGDGRATGTAGQVDMLHQGLASLLASHTDGKAVLAPVVGFRRAEGAPIKWSKPGADLKIPDDLRMHSSAGATYGEAKRELAAQNMQRHADAARTQIEKRVEELTSRLEGRKGLKESDAQAWFGERKLLEKLLKKGTPEALVAEANALEGRVDGEQKIFSSKRGARPNNDLRSERTQDEPHRPLAPKVGSDGQRARSKWRSDVPAGTESQIVFKDHTVTTDHEGNVFRSKASAEAFMRKENIEGKVRKLGGKLLDNWVIDTKIRAVDPKPLDVALETQAMMADRPGTISRSLSEDLANPDKPRTNEDHTGEKIGEGRSTPSDARKAARENAAAEAALAAKKKARPAEKPVDEPVKAAPQNILEGAIKRHTEYLENPPDDYTPAEAQKRGQWAEKQLARVQVELDKIKGSDDYDRQDQLSDYKFALKRLVAKAKEMVEADAELENKFGPQYDAKYYADRAKTGPQDGDAKYNTELPDLPHGASKEEVEAFHAAVARRFNGAVTSAVHELLTGKNAEGEKIPLSGKWVEGAIHASRYAKNIGQVGAHESFHEFFNRLREAARFMVPKGETPPDSKTMAGASKIMSILDRAANSEPVVRQLQRLLDGEHEALKQIENGAKDYAEERMTYMFQFHQAGLLKLGPETQNVFQRINKFFRKILGVLDNDQKAEAIMRSFDEGKMPTADAAARVLATNIEAREHLYKQVNEALSPLTDKLSRLANTTETNLKRAGAPQYDQVRRLFKRSVGEDGEQGFLDAKDHKMKLYMNKVANIFHGLEPKDLELAAKYLHSGKPATDPVVKGIVAKVKGELLPELEKYMREAGVKRLAYDEATGKSKWEDFGHVEGYFPRALDTGLLMKDPNAVVADLVKWNGAELQKMADDFNAGAAKAGGGDLAPRTADDVAKGLLNRLTNSFGQPDLQESTSSVGMSPFMQAVNKRELHWLAPEFLEKYGDKDVARVLTGYVAQAVKRAEYTRRFGPDGKVLKDLLTGGYEHNVERFQAEGLSKEKAEARALKIAEGAAKDVMAMEGTLGYDIGPKMRKFQNSMLVYQNLRVLSTSLFSQFIDPMGMVVRGAEMSDAWNAYKRGLKEVLASFKGEHISDKDSLIADQVGTTDAGGALAAFGQLYSSQYMGAGFRKANDMLFKYNGMEGFNRGMQVAGTRAAINFVKRHVERAMKGDERSADYLKELNLDAKEVKIDKDGELDYTNPKIQDALHQWVNGSVMRPNAAQRPAWGSDPHYMIFWHMKQFAYTFHDVIMKRAIHDAKKYGDMGPAGVLVAAYTPIMIASDALKNVLLTGQEPGWMRAGLPSEIEHGAMRAGLMGKFQPLGDVALNPSRSVLGLGGPVVEQIAQMMDQSPKDIALNAAPGANLLNMWMGNNHIEVQGED